MMASDLKRFCRSSKDCSWFPEMELRDEFPRAKNYQLKRLSILIRSLFLYYRARVCLGIKRGVSQLRYRLR